MHPPIEQGSVSPPPCPCVMTNPPVSVSVVLLSSAGGCPGCQAPWNSGVHRDAVVGSECVALVCVGGCMGMEELVVNVFVVTSPNLPL